MHPIRPAFAYVDLFIWLKFVFGPQSPPECQIQQSPSHPERRKALLVMMLPHHHHQHTPTKGSNLHPTQQPQKCTLHPKPRRLAPISLSLRMSRFVTYAQRLRRTQLHSWAHLLLMTRQWEEGLLERFVLTFGFWFRNIYMFYIWQTITKYVQF